MMVTSPGRDFDVFELGEIERVAAELNLGSLGSNTVATPIIS